MCHPQDETRKAVNEKAVATFRLRQERMETMTAEYEEWLARFQQECRDAEAWQAALRDKVRRDIFVRSQALGVSEEAVSAVLGVLARGAEEIGKAATPWPHEPYTKGSAGCSGSFGIADNLRRALDVLRQESARPDVSPTHAQEATEELPPVPVTATDEA